MSWKSIAMMRRGDSIARAPPNQRRLRPRPIFELAKSRLDELAAEWEPRTTAKQRIAVMLIHRQLRAEDYQVGKTLVCDYWRERRRRRAEIYIPLIHRAGEEAAAKLIWLALRNVRARWKNPPITWQAAKAQLAIQFEDRFPLTE